MKNKFLRLLVEMGFIIFLFYSNLLMGEFTRSHLGQEKGLIWALGDILTLTNFIIAIFAAFIGYIFFEYLRKMF